MSGEEKDGEGFLSRWSRRKQGEQKAPAAAAEPVRPDAAAAGAAPASVADERAKAGGAEEPVDLARLPRIEDIGADTDITSFLKKGVPEDLRRLALRKVWTTDPMIRDFIEMAENQYNWNDPDSIPGFGRINSGTSMEHLLAQARGALPGGPSLEERELAAKAGAGSAAEAGVASVPAQQSSEPASETGESPDDVSKVLADNAEARTVQANVKGAPPVANSEQIAQQSKRRRHGGALPS